MPIAGTLNGKAVEFDFVQGIGLGWYAFSPDWSGPQPVSLETVIAGTDPSNDILGTTRSNIGAVIASMAKGLAAMNPSSVDDAKVQDYAIMLNKLILINDEINRVVLPGPPGA